MVTSVATVSANTDYLRYEEQSSSSTPDSGYAIMYFKTDGLLYTKDDAGLETGPITNAAAIILDPLSSSRNTIQPTTDNFVGLVFKPFSSALTHAVEFYDSGDNLTGFIRPDGYAQFEQMKVDFDPTTSGAAKGLSTDVTWSPSGISSQTGASIDAWLEYDATTYAMTGVLHGIFSNTYISGGGETITAMRAFHAAGISDHTGTTAAHSDFYSESFSNDSGGTITDLHAFYAEDVLAGSNNYAWRSNAGLVVFNEGGHADADIRIETNNEDHFFYIDAGADWLRIGDWDTNYTQWSAVGIQTMIGTGRVKKILNLPVDGTGGGSSKPTFTEAFAPFDGYLMSIGDDLHYEFEVPYDCDTSEDMAFTIHWYIDRAYADENAEVNWQIAYRSVTEDGTEPVDSGGSSATVASGDINIPGTNKSYLETSMTIVAANIELSDHLGVDFSRIALVGGTDPGGAKEPIVSQVHVEYTSNRLGQAL